MQLGEMLRKYVEALIAGNRSQAREIVRKAISTGIKAETIYKDLLYPAMSHIQRLYREDKLLAIHEHLATRINRFITDQVQAQLLPKAPNGKKAVIICAETQAEELGGQVASDILEAAGWQPFFLGGGVAEDELIELIGGLRPELLVVYGSSPSGVPQIRQMIERIRDIGASPMMNVIVTGGIFDRVEGLWEEIHADYYAPDPVSVAQVAEDIQPKVHLPKDPEAPKRRRRLVSNAVGVN